MSELNKPTQTLADYSRQPIVVGIPAIFIYSSTGVKLDSNLVRLGTELRTASALERIADALEEANESRQADVFGATLNEGEGRLNVVASMEKGGNDVKMQFSFTNPTKAAAFFDEYAQHAKAVVDAANEQEGGGHE